MAGSAIRVPQTYSMTGEHGDDNPATSVPSRRELNESRTQAASSFMLGLRL